MTDDTLVVTFMNGPADGRWVIVHNPRVTIGRDSGNDVVIDFDAKVAATHLLIEHAGGQWQLVDNSGGSGVSVDGQPVRERARLQPDQLVLLGDTLLKLSIAGGGLSA